MPYRVELTARAGHDLRLLYRQIHAESSIHAFTWFNGLEAIIYGLETHPKRGAIAPESKKLRHLLYGNKPHIYRVIYAVYERAKKVRVLHIRHGARDAFMPEQER